MFGFLKKKFGKNEQAESAPPSAEEIVQPQATDVVAPAVEAPAAAESVAVVEQVAVDAVPPAGQVPQAEAPVEAIQPAVAPDEPVVPVLVAAVVTLRRWPRRR